MVNNNPNSDSQMVSQALQGNRGVRQRVIAEIGMGVVATLLRKNKDYGSSVFSSPILAPKVSAEESIRVRLSDKVKRLANLLSGEQPEIKAESIVDTMLDLNGYSLLWLALDRLDQLEKQGVHLGD